MSSFRRTKKPVRPRVVMLNADSDDEDMDDSPSPVPSALKAANNGSSKSTTDPQRKIKMEDMGDKIEKGFKSKPIPILSFTDDVEGDGEEEVFKIKKSSVARRLMKQREREKKELSKPKSSIKVEPFGESKTQKLTSQVEGFTEQIKIKKEPKEIKKEKKDFMRVLNGREAEAIDMEDEEDTDAADSRHKFKRPNAGGAAIQDAVRRALEQGQIPDANLIHEARKRKQMAREMGTEFVPVENVERFRNDKSRLVREDDGNDQSDEERLDFSSATNATKIERERRIEEFNAARDEEGSGGDSDEELNEWETQQIRKGVSQATMHNVAKEKFHQQAFNPPAAPTGFMSSYQENSAYPGFSYYPNSTNDQNKSKGRTQAFMEQSQRIASIEEIVNGSKKITPEIIMKQMSERLEMLKISRERNTGELGRLKADLQLAEKELKEANEVKFGLNSRFIMYQTLRGYVTDVVDCLRCKIPVIEILEKRMIELMRARKDRFAERRRQDVKDQMEEVSATVSIMAGNPVGIPPPANGERTRRAAEREGRRTRRRRLREREMKDVKVHKEGLSSDDEETDFEANAYKTQIENILREAELVFDDVHEDFGTIEGILARFEEWRDSDFDSYKESYAFLCLPKCIAPLIRLHLIAWDPLKDGCDLMKFPWIKSLITYAYRPGETIEILSGDPDCRIIPSIAEKVLLPWINRVVQAKWDPVSNSQTRELVNVLNRLIDEWSVSPNTKSIHSLFQAVVTKFKDSLDNDVYMPIYPKPAMANIFSPASVFSARQFWSSVKLLDNMSKWQGLLSDKPLQTLALDALLTRYTLLGIRVTPDLGESVERTKGVVNVLPRAWLVRDGETEVPSGLQQLNRCLVILVQAADCTVAANRIAIPEIANILKTIGFSEEGQMILRKYS